MALNLKLSHQLSSISAAAILGVGAIAAIHLHGMPVQANSIARADAANELNNLARTLHVNLLESRRAKKEILLRNDLKYAERNVELQKKIAGA